MILFGTPMESDLLTELSEERSVRIQKSGPVKTMEKDFIVENLANNIYLLQNRAEGSDGRPYSQSLVQVRLDQVIALKKLAKDLGIEKDVHDKVREVSKPDCMEPQNVDVSQISKMEEFEQVCKTVIDFLRKYYNPVYTAIIKEGLSRVVSDELGVPDKVQD